MINKHSLNNSTLIAEEFITKLQIWELYTRIIYGLSKHEQINNIHHGFMI